MNWFEQNWKIIAVGIISLVLGGYINYKVNESTNDKLLKELKAELAMLQLKANTGRISAEGQQRITELQAQISILEKK